MPNRKIEIVRAAWGAALLFTPRQMLAHVHHVELAPATVLVARILGARQLTQAVVSGRSPSPEVLAMGVWVDAVHASSMIALAVVDHSRARGGLTDAAVAAVWAGAGYRDLSTGVAPPPVHERRRDVLARWVLARAPGGAPLRRDAARLRQEQS